MIKKASEEVDSLSRLQCSKETPKVLEDSVIVVLIIDLVTLEYDTAFELAQ
jgi:hypothetical protein